MRREDIVAAYGQADRSWVTRYAFAVVLATAGMLVTLALTPDDAELYAVLVGVAAVTAWFGGLGPAARHPCVGLGVPAPRAPVRLGRPSRPRGDALARDAGDRARGRRSPARRLRRGREQASTAASTAEASFRDMVGLQELATTLLDAVTPSDVAQALVERVPSLVGARGASFGLVEGARSSSSSTRGCRARLTNLVFDFPWTRERRSRRRRAAGRRSRSKVARRSSGTSRTAQRSRSTRSERSQFPSRLRGKWWVRSASSSATPRPPTRRPPRSRRWPRASGDRRWSAHASTSGSRRRDAGSTGYSRSPLASIPTASRAPLRPSAAKRVATFGADVAVLWRLQGRIGSS